MDNGKSKGTAIAVFRDQWHAQRAIVDLKSAGFSDEQIQQLGAITWPQGPGEPAQP
jgi:hypothetical protein